MLSTVTEGKAFNLSCSFIGGSLPPEILWYKDGSAEVEEGCLQGWPDQDGTQQSSPHSHPKEGGELAIIINNKSCD